MSGIEPRNEGETMEGQDMENTIEVTDLADVKPGDMVTASFKGHEFTGEAWYDGDGDLRVGGAILRWRGIPRRPGYDLVRAVRKVEPLKPGIYVEAGRRAFYDQGRARVGESGEVGEWAGFPLGLADRALRDLIRSGLADGTWIHCGEPADD